MFNLQHLYKNARIIAITKLFKLIWWLFLHSSCYETLSYAPDN